MLSQLSFSGKQELLAVVHERCCSIHRNIKPYSQLPGLNFAVESSDAAIITQAMANSACILPMS
jgi:hypothetical protein